MGSVTCSAAPANLSSESSWSSNEQTLIQAADPTVLTPLVLESDRGNSWFQKTFGYAKPFTLEIKVFIGDLQSYKNIQTKQLIKRIL